MENVFDPETRSAMAELYGEEEHSPDEIVPTASSGCNKAGHYHVYCKGLKAENPDHKGRNSVIRLDLEILAGDHPDQVGRMIFHRIRLFKLLRDADNNVIGVEPYKHDYLAQHLRFATGLGIIPPDKPVRFADVNWSLAENCQAVVRVDAETDEYTDKQTGEKKSTIRYGVNFGNCWRPFDEAVADVPKDAESLAMLRADQPADDSRVADI